MSDVVLLMAERRGLVEELRLSLGRLRELKAGAGPAVWFLAETVRLVAEQDRLLARIEDIEEAISMAGSLSCLN